MQSDAKLYAIFRQLAGMSSDQLEQISKVILGILNARQAAMEKHGEGKEDQSPNHASIQSGKPRLNGHYELKTIHGHQYWYLRYRDGERYRSVYIGKHREVDPT